MFDKMRVMALSKQFMDGQIDTDSFYQTLTRTLARRWAAPVPACGSTPTR